MKRSAILIPVLSVLSISTLVGCGEKKGGDEYTKDGKLILNLRNLYFNDWTGGDAYTEIIQDKFNVSIKPSAYSWASWEEQVTSAVNGNNIGDVFHFDIDNYNFGQYYNYWAEGNVTKALPDDMSKWPNIQSLLDDISNLDALKIDGKLYGIPVAKDITSPDINYSPFTYVYRRDWAKKLGVYQEDDVYTWDQFTALLDAFDKQDPTGKIFALGDEKWGFPSITNFYKDVPHCFALGSDGKYTNNFATDNYIQGLEKAKSYVKNTYYGYSQYSAKDGDVNKEYVGNRCGVLYENLSYSNYKTIRDNLRKSNIYTENFNLDDASAILKVKGPDGKFALEGTDNWFSMTMFNWDISDEKLEKILDIIDYLLSPEGTMLATYGIEGYDYTIEGGKVVLSETGWPKDNKGEYVLKTNGAKYLRYMATLNYDIQENDPLTDKNALKVLQDWDDEMSEAKDNNQLRVLMENSEVMWLSTPSKDQYSGSLLTNANADVLKYCYDGITNIEDYKRSVNSGNWTKVLNEINTKLGK